MQGWPFWCGCDSSREKTYTTIDAEEFIMKYFYTSRWIIQISYTKSPCVGDPPSHQEVYISLQQRIQVI